MLSPNLDLLSALTLDYQCMCSLSPLSGNSDSSIRPMSHWNDAALVSLWENLKLNVLLSTGLSGRLEKPAGGFMSRREAQIVRELPSNTEQVDKVIDTLRGKSDEDFQKFCTMLRDSNQGVWADELERAAEHFKRGKGTCRERK